MASFWLEYTEDGQQRQFSFDTGTVAIGRDKTADFVLDHPTVSRQHALIRVDQRGPQLVVLSRGGLTAIDGGQVQGEQQLYDGSEIHFGQLSFTFRSTVAPPKPAPSPATNAAMKGFAPSAVSQSSDGTNGAAGGWDPGGSGGWGNADASGPGAAPASPPSASPAAPKEIVSWDQIANSAEAQDDYNPDGRTDFQKIQAAQAKADAQTKGNNPWIIYGGAIGIVALAVWSFWPRSVVEEGTVVELDDPEAAFITWEKGDIDCVGRANCRAEALNAYKVGKSLDEQSGADITNPYESYRQFDRSQRLLEQAGITPVPDEMADVLTLQTKVKADLDVKFRTGRLNYRNFATRKMYKQMAGELNRLQAYFPDKRCLYNQWAVEKERWMKDEGVYPVRGRRF